MIRVFSNPSVIINKKLINNTLKLFEMIDLKYYSKDLTINVLLQILQILIEYRMDGTFDNGNNDYIKDTIINRINSEVPEVYNDIKNNIILPIISNTLEVKQKDIDTIAEAVELNVKFGTILREKDKLSDILTDLSSSNVSNLKKAIKDYETFIGDMQNEFKNSTLYTNKEEFVHLLDSDFPDNYLREIYKKIKNPKANLITGLKLFNKILSVKGGFLNGKYYMFYADVNSFKSALLQHISRWLQRYNNNSYYLRYLETKKQPTILHINLENFLQEDAERFYKMYTKKNLGEYQNFDDIKNEWYSSINSNVSSCINITLVHKDADEVSPSDIDTMIDTLYDDGYEVIAVVIDYIELMKADEKDRNKEKREQLANISAQLHSLAGRRDIPVITAHQINREGQRVINDAKNKGQRNAIKLLNRSYIGEAMAIDKKTDFSMFIGIEKGPDGKLYLCGKREKCRYYKSDIDYFVHEIINGIYIEDDILYGPDVVLSKLEIPASANEEEQFVSSENEVMSGSRGVIHLKKNKKVEESIVIKSEPQQHTDIDLIANYFVFAQEYNDMFIYPDEQTIEQDEEFSYYSDDIFVFPNNISEKILTK